MTERTLDELGPVDYLVVEFPAGQQNFTGEAATELLRLHDAGLIRVLDLVIIGKGDDGTIMAQELGDVRTWRVCSDRDRARGDARRGGRARPRRGHAPRERGRRPRLREPWAAASGPRSVAPAGSSSPTAASPSGHHRRRRGEAALVAEGV